MASVMQFLLFLCFVLFFGFSYANQQQQPQPQPQPQPKSQFQPNALVLPVRRDQATHLYVADIRKRTPQVAVPFVVNLNGRFLWVNCENNYLSSSYNAPQCHSSQCAMANTHVCRACGPTTGPGCNSNSCALLPFNPVTRKSATGELAEDTMSIQSVQSSKAGPLVTVPRFLFGCAPSSLIQGPLPSGVQGFAGLGHTRISLQSQLASQFGLKQKFALCLGPNGVIFFGNGPYNMQPGINISQPLTNTPLIVSRKGKYYIGVSSININDKNVPINTTSLNVNPRGYGGTKISTVTPYTVMKTDIYKAVTEFFANEFSHVPRVTPVAPFSVCFDASKITSTRLGPGVPNIDLVLHQNNVVWRITGANSMTLAADNAMCLAFVDGGANPKAAIVLGAHQLEDNLLQFDLTTSRLGFSNSLLGRQTTCSNFNFGSKP